MKLNPTNGLAVFTDGSAYHKDRTGGWAWVALDSFEGTHTKAGNFKDVTISQMELYAVTHALYSIYTEYTECEVLVYSDSEYVVLGVNHKTRARRKNLDWWEALDSAISLHDHVEFHHIKGHSTNEYNKLADKLAGKARKESK